MRVAEGEVRVAEEQKAAMRPPQLAPPDRKKTQVLRQHRPKASRKSCPLGQQPCHGQVRTKEEAEEEEGMEERCAPRTESKCDDSGARTQTGQHQDESCPHRWIQVEMSECSPSNRLRHQQSPPRVPQLHGPSLPFQHHHRIPIPPSQPLARRRHQQIHLAVEVKTLHWRPQSEHAKQK